MTAHPPRWRRLAVAALLLSTPLLWGSSAHAEPAGTVTFTGGCALDVLAPLGDVSADPAEVTVAAGGEVRFVNDLGKRATLSLDGEAVVELPSGGSVGVVFHDGPIRATMGISCMIGGVSGASDVEVVPSATPEPTHHPAAEPTSTPTGDGTPDGTDTGTPGSGAGDGVPAPPVSSDAWSDTSDPAGSSPEQSQEDAADTVPEELTVPRWNVQPDQDETVEPDSEPAASDQGTGSEQEGAQLTHTSGGGAGGGPNGMLALVATVCLAGVTTGAVRAIISHRSARAEWA